MPLFLKNNQPMKSLKTFVCSATSGLLSIYDGHLRNRNWGWQDNTDASGGEAGDQGSRSSWNNNIGIPHNLKAAVWGCDFQLAWIKMLRCYWHICPQLVGATKNKVGRLLGQSQKVRQPRTRVWLNGKVHLLYKDTPSRLREVGVLSNA